MKRDLFFADVRKLHGGRLSPSQVKGYEAILDEVARLGWRDERWTAYALATAYHETGGVMVPVRETNAATDEEAVRRLEAAWKGGRLKSVKTPYWRPDGVTGLSYFGRGDIQITHKDNYAKAGARLGLDLVHHPELALKIDIAARILLVGMSEGWFARDARGPHTLGRHFADEHADPVAARRIVNGADRARDIAGYYETMLAALRAARG